MNAVQQHLDKLKIPDSAVRQYAVAALFDALWAPGVSQHVRDAALRQCLQLKDLRALEVAVSKLQEQACSGGYSPQDAIDALMTALSVADAQACGCLVRGLLAIWTSTHIDSTAGPASASATGSGIATRSGIATGRGGIVSSSSNSGDWRTHVLSRALQANPAAVQPLLLGALSLLSRTAGTAASGAAGAAAGAAVVPGSSSSGSRVSGSISAGSGSFEAALAALQPFLAFVLLSPEVGTQFPSLPSELHSGLARFACCASWVPAQHAMLCLLVAYLPGRPVQLPAQQGTLAEAVGDIMDLVESCSEEPGKGVMSELACHLITLCYDLAQHGGPMQPLLAALRQLAAYWPLLLLPHLVDLAHLVAITGGQECVGLLSLLALQLDHLTSDEGAGLHPAERALLLPPLLQLLAFQQDPTLKRWAAHNLSRLASIKSSTKSPINSNSNPHLGSGGPLRRLPDSSGPEAVGGTAGGSGSSSPGRDGLRGSGGAALTMEALCLLLEMWQDASLALSWLRSLSSWLLDLTPSAYSLPAGSAQLGSKEQRQLSSHVSGMLCALLCHPEPSVQVVAVQALEAALATVPLLGMSLLPVLVHRTQQLVECFLSGQVQEPPASLLPLLRALPALAQHTAVVPFVVRAIQPLLSPGAPEVLQATALRLLCLLWRQGGRGYQHLRTAILGFAAPGQKASLELRVARAEAVREVCEEDPIKGVELIRVIQECLEDSAPQVQALALRCISLLCEADSLDFYKAWRVVQAAFPSLPPHPQTAAAWVGLMGQGVLDADVYPEVAKGIVSALWLATSHPAAQVRRQAYESLATYSPQLLEQIEGLPLLVEYVELLCRERAPANRPACKELVVAALAYEHATRRRVGGPAAFGEAGSRGKARQSRAAALRGAGTGDAAVVAHRLLSTIPRLLLGGSTSNASEVLQRLQELPPIAVLSFYAAPPPTSTTAAGAAAAAKDAATNYKLLALELLKQPLSTQLGTSASVACRAAWQRLLRRWAAAVRAAGLGQDSQEAATVAGAGAAGAAQLGGSGGSGVGSGSAHAAAVMVLWAAIQPQLADPSPTVAENAVWAAAALCGLGQQPVKEAVHAVHAELLSLTSAQQAPAAVQCAALAALGAAAGHVKAVLGLPAVAELARVLSSALQQSPSLGVRAAAAQGLGLACLELHQSAAAASGDGNSGSGSGIDGALCGTLLDMLGALLSTLCSLLGGAGGADTSGLEAAAAAAGVQLQRLELDGRARDGGELLAAVCSGLAYAVPAAAGLLAQPLLLQQLHSMLSTPQQAQQTEQALQLAACPLLAATTAEGLRGGWLSNSQVASSLEQLLGLLGRSSLLGAAPGSAGAPGSQAADGRVVGAAAAALGALLPALVNQGYAPDAQQAPEAVLQALLQLAESSAAKLAHTAAAKQGIAEGMAGLLGPAAGIIESGSPSYKAALKALEGLALSEPDPRVRRGCGSSLAELCCQVKAQQAEGRPAGGPAVSEGPGGAAAAKSLAALPEEGAMRPLVESLLEGRWAPGVDSTEEEEGAPSPQLTAADVASILRCLAAAERLPALNFGTLCRRLLRSHPGSTAVEEGCIALAAAHGQVQQLQLGDFIADQLDPPKFQQLSLPAQLAALRALPALLGALPQSQGLSTLRLLCGLCPDASSLRAGAGSAAAAEGDGGAEAEVAVRWSGALLAGLHGVLSSGGQPQKQAAAAAGVAAAALPPAVQHAAQQLLVEVVLPRMPRPGALPVSLPSGAAEAAAGEGGRTAGEECWQAAVLFFEAFSPQKLEGLLGEGPLYAALPLPASSLAAALVARGALSPRALQGPRNLLLNGTLAGRPAEEDGVALFLGRAVAGMPSAPQQQQQWLMEVLEAAKTCANPEGALKLACCLLSCLAAAAACARPSPELALAHLTAVSCQAGTATLAHSLALLGEAPAWKASLSGILHKLSAAVSALESGKCGAGGPSGSGAACDWGRLLEEVMLGLRHQLPSEMWGALAARLARDA